MVRFNRMFRYDPVKDPTARLRLSYDEEWGTAILSDENVLPEQADNPDARNIQGIATVDLTTAQVRWLAEVASDLADLMEQRDATAQAELEARASR